MGYSLRKWFSKFAVSAAKATGSARAFFLACVLVGGWFVSGPYFNWSDSWSLFINTVTTVVTYLMVFVIQSSQNRDMAALQVKLDEILLAVPEARNTIVAIDIDSDEDKIQEVREEVKENAGLPGQGE